jgi:DNA topoisomerase-1
LNYSYKLIIIIYKMSKLLIVESPGKIKKISEYLGNDYIVLASYGHIIDLY